MDDAMLTLLLKYSGLLDTITFTQVQDGSADSLKVHHRSNLQLHGHPPVRSTCPLFMQTALGSSDGWLAFEVAPAQLDEYAELAIALCMQRVLFAVKEGALAASESEGHAYRAIGDKLAAQGVRYTIVRYGEYVELGEGRAPYRIRPGLLPLPAPAADCPHKALASGDLFRVVAETFALPKAFDKVFALGVGSLLDSEVLCYMKAQGWPEGAQVAVLLGGIMEGVDKRYAEQQAAAQKNAELAVL
jgi:hypothetical protein